MNIVFWVLAVAAMVLLWALLSFLFPLIGSLFIKLWDDILYNIRKDEKK